MNKLIRSKETSQTAVVTESKRNRINGDYLNITRQAHVGNWGKK
jgi:hypothetical protein